MGLKPLFFAKLNMHVGTLHMRVPAMPGIWLRPDRPSTGGTQIVRQSKFHVENNFIKQRNAVQTHRTITARRDVEVADDPANSKSLPLIELQCLSARRRSRNA